MHRFLLFLCLLINSALATTAQICPLSEGGFKSTCSSTTPLSHWAKILGWTPTAASSQNLCGGYYAEPETIRTHPNPQSISDMQMNITSTGTAIYNLNTASIIEGNVTLKQVGREIRADKVVLTPNPKTGQIDQIDLRGDVHFQEAGILVVGKTSHIDMAKKTVVVKEGAYHMVRPSKIGNMDAWGTADEAHRESPTFSWFKQATYTTCAPTDPQWHIKSKHIALDKNTGRGTAKNVVIYAEEAPVFYLPYLSFPIDKRRYSGFLYPNFGYDNESGAFLRIPYYFNIAPNYDDTLTLIPMSQRGVMANNWFRYLTQKGAGSLQVGFLPNDRAFENLKQTVPQSYPPSSYNNPFLAELAQSSNNRGNVAFHNDLAFNRNWSSVLDVNYVTDAYYFQDLGNNANSINTDQLLNQAVIAYQGERWQFSGMVQAWQTLHPINQTFVSDQYERLPALNLSSFWPDEAYGLNYAFNSEWVYFDHADDFFTGAPYPTGNRLHVNPQISLPWSNSSAFFIPTLGLDATTYSVINNAVVDMNVSPPILIPNSDPNLNTIRALPIFDLDGGLYFDRDLFLGGKNYHQTLEPRLFYLFVPTTNQNNIPIFDTTLPPFSFDELFRTNRFMGYDRIGDANQISLGLTSRLLSSYTGEEKINASIGAIFYFRKHSVCLYPDCSDDPTIDEQVSPIAAQLSYHLNPQISITGNAAWDATYGQMNNDGVRLQYSPAKGEAINVGYNYVKNGDILNPNNGEDSINNLHRIDLSITWPLPHTTHWNVVGDWNYNISHHHPQTYLYGLEYDSCCWAIRLISSRVLQSENSMGNVTFRSAYYVQFLLKGLGSVGDASGASLLQNSIPGYFDLFK